ncbi:MAG: DUF1559 domain-containing protein [Thermoguttaceae bacterium]|jgi:hypothetical protein|nr:DUF1559 domain-containing protein [Thermoguttaceae bacterium]
MTENRPPTKDPNDDFVQQDRKNRRLLWSCGAVVALLLAMTVYVNLSQSRPLQIAKETTYITEPLKSDTKQVDYFAAIRQATRPENAATDENGYRLIVRHLGKGQETEPWHFAQVCAELGLDPDALQSDMQYQGTDESLWAYVQGDQFDEALFDELPLEDRSRDDVHWMLSDTLHRPWTLDELPMMAAWLEQNASALDLVGRAVRKPTFHIPLARRSDEEPLDSVRISELQRFRLFTRGLSARANHRIATGDIDGAIDDIIACKRLGRHVRNGPFLVDFFVGIAIEGIADALGIAGSLEHAPTKEQLERFLGEMDKLPPPVNVDDILAVERFAGLDFIQLASYGKESFESLGFIGGGPPGILARLSIDWNAMARRFNEVYDEILATGSQPLPKELTLGSSIRFVSIRARSEYWGEVVAREFWPDHDTVLEVTRRRECAERMQRITLAMFLYECHHGTLPPAWSVDAAGNPLHGWRVLLLPYLDQEELYARIRLDEPWDSEHNRQFHGEVVEVYCCPSDPDAGPGETTYSVVVGPDMPFEAGAGKRLADFGPHSDDMILLVERTDPVGWMDPTRDVTQAAADEGICVSSAPPSPEGGRIGSRHWSAANFGFRNGAVRSLSTVEDDCDEFESKEERRKRFKRLLRGTNAEKTIDY